MCLVFMEALMSKKIPNRPWMYYTFVWFGAVLFTCILGLFMSTVIYGLLSSVTAWLSAFISVSEVSQGGEINVNWLIGVISSALSGSIVGMFYYKIIFKDVLPMARWWVWASAGITILLYLWILYLYA